MVDSIGIIGVGLIGGSLARGLRKTNWCNRIIGFDANHQTINDAQRLSVIDEGFVSIADCAEVPEMVVIAVPVSRVKGVLNDIKPWFSSSKAITDVSSTKQNIIDELNKLFAGEIPACFVPGHPIAGREQSGVLAAVDDLYAQRKVILTPSAITSANSIELVTTMWQQVGAHVEHLEIAEHDQILAATSHLPHVIAYTLVHCLSTQTHTPEIFRYAAGGFADFTRIASSDPELWRDICLANRTELLKSIDEFDMNLKQLRTSLENGDGDSLQAMFVRAKKARDQFSNS